MRTGLNIVGALCLLTGVIWILQGINVLPGSFMTGQTKWAVYGAIVLAAGVGFLFSANPRPAGAATTTKGEMVPSGTPRTYREARSAADAQSRYVYVEDDGSIRELTPAECEFLAAPFVAFDSGRPYVKERYGARTLDNHLRGFLERGQIPWRLRWKVKSR